MGLQSPISGFSSHDIPRVRNTSKTISFVESPSHQSLKPRYTCQYVEVRRATTNQAAWWLGTQTALAFFRVVVWIWDPKFDDYTLPSGLRTDPLNLEHFKGQDLAIMIFSKFHYTALEIWTFEILSPHTLEFPELLLGRLKGMKIFNMLEQTMAIATRDDPYTTELKNCLLNECTAVWDFPPKLFSKWLAYQSKNIKRIQNPIFEYSCKIVNLGGSEPWVGGVIILLQVIAVGYHRPAYRTAFRSKSDWLFRSDHAELKWYQDQSY